MPSKLPKIAAWVAFVMAALIVLSALLGTIAVLPAALVPLAAGIGILRRRVWSARGFGIYCLGQLALAMFRVSGVANAQELVQLVAAGVFSLVLGVLFLLAGSALAASGAPRGRAWPWIALTAVFTLGFLVFRPFAMPTGSMEDTLLVGDYILVETFPRLNPVRGDMVVFHYPIDHRQTFVKRVVGVAGDRIHIVNKDLYRNGEKLSEPYARHKMDYMDSYRDNFPSNPNTPIYAPAQTMLEKNVTNGEVVVPAGKFFVMGDNRDQSLDSRYWGFVGADEIIGKPVLIYDSHEQSTEQMSGGSQTRPGRTRWDRLFKVL